MNAYILLKIIRHLAYIKVKGEIKAPSVIKYIAMDRCTLVIQHQLSNYYK